MTSGVRLTDIAILVLLIVCQSASARSLLQSTPLFVPAGLDSCTIYVPSGCTLNTEAAPRANACSQNNSDQLTSVVTAADNDQGVKIAFYGDSITKLWRDRDGHGQSLIYKQYFGNFSAAVLGVGGDQTSNLWWRLLHGQIFTKHAPQVTVMLIGTNDLGTASCGVGEPGIIAAVPGVFNRTDSMVRLLKDNNPRTVVILVGVLPRGDNKVGSIYPTPNKYTQSIKDLNARLYQYAAEEPFVVFVDCTEQMLLNGTIDDSVFTDGLHPTEIEGMGRLANCISFEITSRVTL
ncbi:platelet-activating factor acetyltransferase activity protein [Trebouxia sp. C0009 RCD-2024]